jgi:glutamate-1-semialdehyde 2,1-aminomutase
MGNKQSKLFDQANEFIPGGVHSPVRSFKGLKSTPRFIEQAEGAYLTDVDGKNYIDFCMSFGPLILGHKDEDVKEELAKALDRGWSFGASEPYSLELARYLVERICFIDKIRFVNSGTEAVMTALRIARGATGKDKVIKFNGCYHGHIDSMLIKAGSGLAGSAEASSAGISKNVASETIVLELGDKESVKETLEKHGKEIAAIIIEPLPANNGLLIQHKEFLSFLRDETRKHQVLLIHDEVISGFRIGGFQGMSCHTGIFPDLVTYGKVIGGGLPVGAVAGKKEFMDLLAPVGPVYQAGTLSANPLAMIGGMTTLKKMTPAAYSKLREQTTKIVEEFGRWLNEYNDGEFSHYHLVQKDSLFWFVSKENVRSIPELPSKISEQFLPLFETLLEKGIYLAPNAYEVGFCSLAHDETVLKDLKNRLWS